MFFDEATQGNGCDRERAGLDGRPCVDFHRVFQADPVEVRAALLDAVACFAQQIAPDDLATLELALAEVLNNVVEHGYKDQPPGPIYLRISREPDRLKCQVNDQGWPMPGLTLPEGRMQPVANRVDDIAEGGWGWALIRELTEELAYRHCDNGNQLTFQIRLRRL